MLAPTCVTVHLWAHNRNSHGTPNLTYLTTDHIPLISTQLPFILTPGPRLNIKTVLSTYGDFHAKDKTAVRTFYL